MREFDAHWVRHAYATSKPRLLNRHKFQWLSTYLPDTTTTSRIGFRKLPAFFRLKASTKMTRNFSASRFRYNSLTWAIIINLSCRFPVAGAIWEIIRFTGSSTAIFCYHEPPSSISVFRIISFVLFYWYFFLFLLCFFFLVNLDFSWSWVWFNVFALPVTGLVFPF